MPQFAGSASHRRTRTAVSELPAVGGLRLAPGEEQPAVDGVHRSGHVLVLHQVEVCGGACSGSPTFPVKVP